MHKRRLGAAAVATAAAVLAVASGWVWAATTTAQFTVNLTINAQCVAGTTVGNMNFPAQGYLTGAAVDATATISYGCTKGTAPVVTLNSGANNGAPCPGGALRCMKHASLGDYVNYDLYTDSGRLTLWTTNSVTGTSGSGTVSGTTPSEDRTITVYGRVPPQSTPTPGSYSDTVTATFTF